MSNEDKEKAPPKPPEVQPCPTITIAVNSNSPTSQDKTRPIININKRNRDD